MHREEGFTIVELLVVVLLLSMVTTAFYQVLFSATGGSEAAVDNARISEEARHGFNRMVRDVREAERVTNVSATSFTAEIDFDTNNTIDPLPTSSDVVGNYETITYTFNSGAGTITASSGSTSEVLMAGISCVRRTDNACEDMFTYSSSRLEYDTDLNGVTSALELDQAVALGNNNLSVWSATEMSFIDRMTFAMRVTRGDSTTEFFADAQLRNRR